VLLIGPGWCRRQLRFEDGRVLLRLDEIRKVRASIRFVSLEPLIGSVSAGDLTNIHWAIVRRRKRSSRAHDESRVGRLD
jgi:protein gp37